jgi:hypothetical protein
MIIRCENAWRAPPLATQLLKTSAVPPSRDHWYSVTRDTAQNIVVTVEDMKDGPDGATVVSRLDLVEVGKDSDGDPMTSCAVIEVEAATQKPSRSARSPKAAQIALRALAEALSDCGCGAPASGHIPGSARVVTLDHWRDYAYRRGISASEAPRARQAAFKRASEHLISSRIVGVWGEHVWIAE